VTRGVARVEQCWDWWSRKNEGVSVDSAKAQALRHLTSLEQRRPLDAIADPEARVEAAAARSWIRRTLLGVSG
jgi:hypothetical protein